MITAEPPRPDLLPGHELLGAQRRLPRVRLHCRFRNRGPEYVSESGIKWMSGSTKRQCDRALRPPRFDLALAVRARRVRHARCGWYVVATTNAIDSST
jgi:hypothetical protein